MNLNPEAEATATYVSRQLSQQFGRKPSLILLVEQGNMQSEMQSCCRKLFCLLCQDMDDTNSWHVYPDSLLVLQKQTPTMPALRLSHSCQGRFELFTAQLSNKQSDSLGHACVFKQKESWERIQVVSVSPWKSSMFCLNMHDQHASIASVSESSSLHPW